MADALPATGQRTYEHMAGMAPCCNPDCLLANTPPVGIFLLKARSMEDSILGKTEAGQTYKLGKGKVTKGNVKAAWALLEREHPQVQS